MSVQLTNVLRSLNQKPILTLLQTTQQRTQVNQCSVFSEQFVVFVCTLSALWLPCGFLIRNIYTYMTKSDFWGYSSHFNSMCAHLNECTTFIPKDCKLPLNNTLQGFFFFFTIINRNHKFHHDTQTRPYSSVQRRLRLN